MPNIRGLADGVQRWFWSAVDEVQGKGVKGIACSLANTKSDAHLWGPALLLARRVYLSKDGITSTIKTIGMVLVNGAGAYALKKFKFTVSGRVAFATMAILDTGMSGKGDKEKKNNQRIAVVCAIAMCALHYVSPPGYAMSKYVASVILGSITGTVLNCLNPS